MYLNTIQIRMSIKCIVQYIMEKIKEEQKAYLLERHTNSCIWLLMKKITEADFDPFDKVLKNIEENNNPKNEKTAQQIEDDILKALNG